MDIARFDNVRDMSRYDDVLEIRDDGRVCLVGFNRPSKHNALSETTIRALKDVFENMPDAIRAVVFYGHGKSFCAGLDLSQHKHREPFESVLFSQMGHQGFEAMRRGGRPIIAALHGAVIGGGMEIAASTHVRVADTTAFFQLPEGRRGIYVGGGGSVHVSKIIGVGRMAEMMLTGRTYDVEQAERLGLVHYVVPQGTALQKAIEIADDVAGNAPICNYLIVRALGHIDSMSPAEGLFTESIAQAISLTSSDSKAGMEAFLSRQKISF